MKNHQNLTSINNAALQLSQLNEKKRNEFLANLSNILKRNKNSIIDANKKDIKKAKKDKLSKAFIQRLVCDNKSLKSMQERLNGLQKLNSGIGTILEEKILPNNIMLRKVSVPIGVILSIYESRPEVTIDVAALCIKSGNAALLKGGTEAFYTNRVLYECIVLALKEANIAEKAVTKIENRAEVNRLLKQNKYIDLIIARGGYEMVNTIVNQSRIPVLAHSSGGARIYVDKSANLDFSIEVLVNAKINKPAACNSLDCILVHKDIEDSFIVKLVKTFKKNNVTVLGDESISKVVRTQITTVWNTEFLGLTVCLKRVKSSREAISFINKYSNKHSEGIIAQDTSVINKFKKSIDVAAVFINCSTRFHDGFEFGLGSEMGIATGKLHARGPVGLKELTTYKWEVYGNGQVRK